LDLEIRCKTVAIHLLLCAAPSFAFRSLDLHTAAESPFSRGGPPEICKRCTSDFLGVPVLSIAPAGVNGSEWLGTRLISFSPGLCAAVATTILPAGTGVADIAETTGDRVISFSSDLYAAAAAANAAMPPAGTEVALVTKSTGDRDVSLSVDLFAAAAATISAIPPARTGVAASISDLVVSFLVYVCADSEAVIPSVGTDVAGIVESPNTISFELGSTREAASLSAIADAPLLRSLFTDRALSCGSN
jgi:hypothetical protein